MGGQIDTEYEVPPFNIQNLKHLYLENMPNINMGKVLAQISYLETLYIKNLDTFDKQQFSFIHRTLTSEKSELSTLALELLPFPLEDIKD